MLLTIAPSPTARFRGTPFRSVKSPNRQLYSSYEKMKAKSGDRPSIAKPSKKMPHADVPVLIWLDEGIGGDNRPINLQFALSGSGIHDR